MNELTKLADLLARRSIENTPPEEAAQPFGDHVAAAINAGDHEIAAAAILLSRRVGRGYAGDIPVETAAAIKRQQAEVAAASFRHINEKNHTNYPLPAWVRSELGVIY